MSRPYKGAWVEAAQRRARIVELYEMGWTAAHIGREVHLSTSTVFYHLRVADRARRPKSYSGGKLSRTNHDSVARTIELYREGRTTREVGALQGLTHSTVRYRLLNAGIQMRPPVKRKRDETVQVLLRQQFRQEA